MIGEDVRPAPLSIKIPVSLIHLDRVHFQPYIPTSRKEIRLVKSAGK
jgi:hypothetical protein